VNGPAVRRAAPEEVDEIVAVLTEAALWLRARGIEQWSDPFPRERVERLVRRGDFYLASLNGHTVGTLALLWSDPAFLGEQPDDAGYVHALAVRREHAGHASARACSSGPAPKWSREDASTCAWTASPRTARCGGTTSGRVSSRAARCRSTTSSRCGSSGVVAARPAESQVEKSLRLRHRWGAFLE
jgi:hypothetical protein